MDAAGPPIPVIPFVFRACRANTRFMSVINIRRWSVISLVLLTSGCSLFSSGTTQRPEQAVEIQLNTSWRVNPDKDNDSQPVKICIIETRRSGWLPPGLYEGKICSNLSGSADIVTFENYIMAPGQRRVYRTSTQQFDNYTRWIVIGAEFQKGVGEYSLIEKMIVPGADFKMEIMAENTSLTIL